jgi:hypothetical protein
MAEKIEEPGNHQDSTAGEIVLDSAIPVEIMVEDEIAKASLGVLSDTLVGVSSVMSADPVEEMDNAKARALISKMNVNERKAVKGRIEEVLKEVYVRGLRDVVGLLGNCMPSGVKKPKLCDISSSRGVRLIDPDALDPETSLTLHIKKVICKISVEEYGVKMYVNLLDTGFVLYCE